MKPTISSLHTVFTNPLFWLLDVSNLVDMNAYFCWHPASIQPAGEPRSLELCEDTRGLTSSGSSIFVEGPPWLSLARITDVSVSHLGSGFELTRFWRVGGERQVSFGRKDIRDSTEWQFARSTIYSEFGQYL